MYDRNDLERSASQIGPALAFIALLAWALVVFGTWGIVMWLVS